MVPTLQMSAAVVNGCKLTTSGAMNSGLLGTSSSWLQASMYLAVPKSLIFKSLWPAVNRMFSGWEEGDDEETRRGGGEEGKGGGEEGKGGGEEGRRRGGEEERREREEERGEREEERREKEEERRGGKG